MSMSKLEICNQSLMQIGHSKQINSLAENTTESRNCNRIYDSHRRMVLSLGMWGFAKSAIVLSETGGTPPPGWGKEYHYPNGCLKALEIARATQDIPRIAFQTGSTYDPSTGQNTKVIWTNEETATLIYTRDVQLTSMFTQMFCETLSARMSYSLANTMAKKKQIQDECWKLFGWNLQQAIDVGEIEAQDFEYPEPEWITSR